MAEIIFLSIIAVCSLFSVILLLLQWARGRGDSNDYGPHLAALEKAAERTERGVRDEIGRNRDEAAATAGALRREVLVGVNALASTIVQRLNEHAGAQAKQLDAFAASLEAFRGTIAQHFTVMRDSIERKLSASAAESDASHRSNREENASNLKAFGDSLLRRLTDAQNAQREQFESFAGRLSGLTTSNEQRMDKLRESVEARLLSLQSDNASKLEQMRATVDEKLHAALEQRLGESFKQVSERLEQVHKGLGEMQSLASGVGDLKKVLSNIKTRGTWGEVQLGNLLEQMLTTDQYEANVKVNPNSGERVEFAVKLPGRGDDRGERRGGVKGARQDGVHSDDLGDELGDGDHALCAH